MNPKKTKQTIKSLLYILALLTLNACSAIYDKHVQWESVEPKNFPVLHAIGYAPISLQKSKHKTQRMLMAIKASKLAAYSELVEQVYGQQITTGTSMGELIINDDNLSSSVNGLIRGAKVVKSYPVGDTYATELVLDFKVVYELYETQNRKKEVKDVVYF